MPIEDVLRAFAEENFYENDYHPVSHGGRTSIKPLALLVKKPRSVFKRPFAKTEFTVLALLEDYVLKDKKEEFTKAVSSAIVKEENLEIEEDDVGDDGAKRFVDVSLEAGKCVNFKIKVADDLGELELGNLDQEYIKDPDLRELLDMTDLDVKKMESLEDRKLRLVFSVINSEKFVLKGKREHEFQLDAGFEADIPQIVECLVNAQARLCYRTKTIPPKVAARYTRGPILFKFVRVDYDKTQGKLKLSEGEFPGHAVRAQSHTKDTFETSGKNNWYTGEYVEPDAGSPPKEECYFAESLTAEDIKKLETIKESVLKSAENREKRKERVKKYLSWFEEALITDKKKLSLVEPLTNEDRKFLQSIFIPVLDRSTVDLSSFDTEKIQGYAIVLKQIADLSDEHWDKIEKAWAEPGQN
ncbi:uncharacterized protein LOC110052423 isoform X1 [Orbicella faveolata]|uniref:uncharacterized protein LOC110052423 isoform X1 n=1 Tax=Orbicella faveolata TaxID=48498 RepID=UPI0009E45DEB|nr:uncharacterized protein LOC110052423 isoform X1 [Orbicella faveolata]XP_020614213.1 uncharacterized protein LOC110052423 isoform X1 [Orbicella faveolata]